MYMYDRPSWTGEVYETESYFPTWINREDAAHVKALVEAAKQACLDGSLKITSAYGRTADQFNELRAWANNE